MGVDDVTPPGDNVPLIEGLDPSWNELVNYIPEDKRPEFAPKFKERISKFDEYKQWDDLQKSGITAEQASGALGIQNLIETNPKQVYDAIAQHLGITPQEAKEVLEDEIDEQEDDDPRFAKLSKLEQTVQAMAGIILGQNQQSQKEQAIAQEEAALNKEIEGVLKKYEHESIPEKQILMRMMHLGMSADEAAQDYINDASAIRKTRPAPRLLSGAGSGAIPGKAIDPTKLDSKGTKNLVAQMLDKANVEAKS